MADSYDDFLTEQGGGSGGGTATDDDSYAEFLRQRRQDTLAADRAAQRAPQTPAASPAGPPAFDLSRFGLSPMPAPPPAGAPLAAAARTMIQPVAPQDVTVTPATDQGGPGLSTRLALEHESPSSFGEMLDHPSAAAFGALRGVTAFGVDQLQMAEHPLEAAAALGKRVFTAPRDVISGIADVGARGITSGLERMGVTLPRSSDDAPSYMQSAGKVAGGLFDTALLTAPAAGAAADLAGRGASAAFEAAAGEQRFRSALERAQADAMAARARKGAPPPSGPLALPPGQYDLPAGAYATRDEPETDPSRLLPSRAIGAGVPTEGPAVTAPIGMPGVDWQTNLATTKAAAADASASRQATLGLPRGLLAPSVEETEGAARAADVSAENTALRANPEEVDTYRLLRDSGISPSAREIGRPTQLPGETAAAYAERVANRVNVRDRALEQSAIAADDLDPAQQEAAARAKGQYASVRTASGASRSIDMFPKMTDDALHAHMAELVDTQLGTQRGALKQAARLNAAEAELESRGHATEDIWTSGLERGRDLNGAAESRKGFTAAGPLAMILGAGTGAAVGAAAAPPGERGQGAAAGAIAALGLVGLGTSLARDGRIVEEGANAARGAGRVATSPMAEVRKLGGVSQDMLDDVSRPSDRRAAPRTPSTLAEMDAAGPPTAEEIRAGRVKAGSSEPVTDADVAAARTRYEQRRRTGAIGDQPSKPWQQVRADALGEPAAEERPEPSPMLSGLHNLTADKLEGAHRLGGFPAPSLAVVPEAQRFDEYGNISLIGKRSLFDPRESAVYDADAYTARAPQPEYPTGKFKAIDKALSPLKDTFTRVGDEAAHSTAWYDLERGKPEDAESHLLRSAGAKAAFLEEQGVAVKPVMQKRPLRESISAEPALREFFAEHGVQRDYERGGEYHQQLTAAAKEAATSYANKTYVADDARDIETMRQHHIERILGKGQAGDRELIPYGSSDRLTGDAQHFGEQEVARYDTEEKIDRLLKPKKEQFTQWVKDKVAPFKEKPFLKIGGRKKPYTLDTATEAATRGPTRGGEGGMTFGPGKARALSATKFDDLEHMRNAASHRIVSPEEVKAYEKDHEEVSGKFRDAVIEHHGSGDTWTALDAAHKAIARFLQGAMKRGMGEGEFAKALRAEGFTGVPRDVVADGVNVAKHIYDAPTDYFEAKPQRAVKFDEFAGAVIPKSATARTRAILTERGIPFREYDDAVAESDRASAGQADRERVTREFRRELHTGGHNTLGAADPKLIKTLGLAAAGAAAGSLTGDTPAEHLRNAALGLLAGGGLGALASREGRVLTAGEKAELGARATMERPPTGPKEAADAITATFAPQTRGEQAATAGQVVRAARGKIEREVAIAQQTLDRVAGDLNKAPIAKKLGFVDAIEHGAQQSDISRQPIANSIRRTLDSERDAIRNMGTGKLDQFLENYFPHLWQDPDAAGQWLAKIMGKRPIEGSKSFLKRRTIPTVLEGMFPQGVPKNLEAMTNAELLAENKRQGGLVPVTFNPVESTMLKLREMKKYRMAQQVIGDLGERGLLKAIPEDGRMPVGYARINDWAFSGKAAPEPVARVLNNYLSPGLRGNAAYDAYMAIGNTLNQAQLGFSAFHAGMTTIETMVSQNALALEHLVQGKAGQALREFATFPGAPFSNYKKGEELRRAYLSAPGTITGPIAAIADGAAEGGARYHADVHNQASTAFSNALEAKQYARAAKQFLPAMMERVMGPVMNELVPRQKMGVFYDLAKSELERLGPEAHPDEVTRAMQRAWDSVDNRMGQVVYDNLFWNRAAKDLFHASVRSVGWNWGTFQELGGGTKDLAGFVKDLATPGAKAELSHRAAYAMALPITLGILGSVTQKLYTGEWPDNLFDMFHPKTGTKDADGNDNRVVLPSYMKDVYSYGQHPIKTLTNKMNPLLSMTADALMNKDFYGDQIYDEPDFHTSFMQSLVTSAKAAGQLARYGAKAAGPFGVENILELNKRGASTSEKVLSQVGITPASREAVRSRAQNLMHDALARRAPQLTPEEATAAQVRAELRDKVRTHGAPAAMAELRAKLRDGTLTQKQVQAILQDDQTPSLVKNFKRLTLADAEKVYRASTSDREKRLWLPILEGKRQRAGQ